MNPKLIELGNVVRIQYNGPISNKSGPIHVILYLFLRNRIFILLKKIFIRRINQCEFFESKNLI